MHAPSALLFLIGRRVVTDWWMLGFGDLMLGVLCVSCAVPLEDYPIRVQHLVRAPARRRRRRSVGMELSSALFVLLYPL